MHGWRFSCFWQKCTAMLLCTICEPENTRKRSDNIYVKRDPQEEGMWGFNLKMLSVRDHNRSALHKGCPWS